MTARSTRRAAEMAVIDAAMGISHLLGGESSDFLPDKEHAAFLRAIQGYEALGLETPDAVPTNQRAPRTAARAEVWFKQYAGSVTAEVFREIYRAWLDGASGLTTDAVEVRLNRTHQSVSPRVTDLRDKGFITDSGLTRKTRSGNDAIVWTPTTFAQIAYRNWMLRP